MRKRKWCLTISAVLLSCNFLVSLAGYAEDEFKKEGEREILELNKGWEFLPVSKISYPPPKGNWAKVDHVSTALHWGVYGEESWDVENAWYRRKILLSPSLEGKRIKIKFWAVAWRSHIYFNGRKVGENLGGYLPFEIDVTDEAKLGEENELLVGVEDYHSVFVDGARIVPTARTEEWYAGIWQKVELIISSQIYIEDVFVRTSVRKKTLGLEITLQNKDKLTRTIFLQNDILDEEKIVKSIPKTKVILKPGEEKIISLEDNWECPKLWWPDSPHLYYLQTKLWEEGRIIDTLKIRFGFREFRADGPNFYLNGVKVRLKSVWGHYGEYAHTIPAHSPKEVWKILKRNNVNCARTHCGSCFPPIWYDAADEVGMLIVCESAVAWEPRNENSLRHTERWVKTNRNHPSIVIWSASNEFRSWNVPRDPKDTDFLIRMQRLILSLDSTRVVYNSGYGRMDGEEMVYCFHNPGLRKCGTPSCITTFPNNFYWPVDESIPIHEWYEGFIWNKDKPICIGEIWDYRGVAGWQSIVGGDRLYRGTDICYNEKISTVWAEIFRMSMEAYRLCDLALITPMVFYPPWKRLLPNPLLEKIGEVYAPLGVYLKEYDHHFYEEEKVIRKTIIYNETLKEKELLFEWKLTEGENVLRLEKLPLQLPPGEIEIRSIEFSAPSVEKRRDLKLALSLFPKNGEKSLISSSFYQISVFPKKEIVLKKKGRIAVFDPKGMTSKIFQKEGIPYKSIEDLTSLRKANFDLLILGYHSLSPEVENSAWEVGKFVKEGGRVLTFEQVDFRRFFPLPLSLVSNEESPQATIVFPRAKGHPLLRGIQENDLKFWAPDNIVVSRNIYKPSQGNFCIVADSGSGEHLERAPLIEIPHGKGRYLICQLDITTKLEKEPMASVLLSNMLNYLLQVPALKEKRIGLITEKGSAFAQVLHFDLKVDQHASWRKKGETLSNYDLLIIEGGALKKMNILEIKEFVERGGIVYLHNLIPQVEKEANILLEADISLEKMKEWRGVSIKEDPLTISLSNYLLFWQDGKAEKSRYLLKVKKGKAIKPLTEPCGLLKVSRGKGYYLINQFLFDENLRDSRALSFGSCLLTNLGVPLPGRSLIHFKSKGYFQVEIDKHCNVGFGPENAAVLPYTGESGEYVGPILEEYWGKWLNVSIDLNKYVGLHKFNNIPFKIIDPKKNNNRACIVLTNVGKSLLEQVVRSNNLDLEKVEGIKVDKKVISLHFLHTDIRNYLTDANKIGEYVINYEDGRRIRVPIREGNELKMWWEPSKDVPNAKLAIAFPHPHPEVALPEIKVGFWNMEWENPYPEKLLKTIDFVSSGQYGRSPVLIAITGLEIELL